MIFKFLSFKRNMSVGFFAVFLAVFLLSGTAQAGFWDWLSSEEEQIDNTAAIINTAEAVSYRTISVTVTPTNGGIVKGEGISCGTGNSKCSHELATEVGMKLTAAATNRHKFIGWAGCPSAAGATCNIKSYDGSHSITANFKQPGSLGSLGRGDQTYTLKVRISPKKGGSVHTEGGFGGINCGRDCSETKIPTSTTVKLVAVPFSGYHFTGWTNCTPITGDPQYCTVTKTKGTITVVAKFAQGPNPTPIATPTPTPTDITLPDDLKTITFKIEGTGTGQIFNANGSETKVCEKYPNKPSATCSSIVTTNQEVKFYSYRTYNSVNKGWEGCDKVTNNDPVFTCDLLMDKDRTITTTFEKAGEATTTATSTSEALTVTTGKANNLTTISATLNGSFENFNGDGKFHFWYTVETDTSHTHGKFTNLEDTNGRLIVQQDITNLKPGTKYLYQLQLKRPDNENDISKGKIESFTTPSVTVKDATEITNTSAKLNATIVSDNDVDYRFSYKKRGDNSTRIDSATAKGKRDVSLTVNNLTPGTKYDFFIYLINENGKPSSSGEKIFTTLNSSPTPTPTVTLYIRNQSDPGITYSDNSAIAVFGTDPNEEPINFPSGKQHCFLRSGTICSLQITSGKQIKVVAYPAVDEYKVKWNGSLCTSISKSVIEGDTCTMTMPNQNTNLDFEFIKKTTPTPTATPTFPLTINIKVDSATNVSSDSLAKVVTEPNNGFQCWNTSGGSTVSCNSVQSGVNYSPNAVVKLVAIPGEGVGFVSWSSDCLSTSTVDNSCQVKMDAAKSVTATFKYPK